METMEGHGRTPDGDGTGPARGSSGMETMDERETAALRRMTPAQKLAVMQSLIAQAYQLAAAGIRATHPGLSEEEVRARVRERMLGSGPGDAMFAPGEARARVRERTGGNAS